MQEKIITTLATEALNPISDFIDAALGPKLERIRINAKKRELKKRLEDKVVNDLLEEYFKVLIRRVSELRTLAFPERLVSLSNIYEPMKLRKSMAGDFKLKKREERVSLAARDLKPGENYLIIDSAGMGKSTYAKYLVLDIFKSTIKVPLFLELRRIGEAETLLGKLSKEIDAHQEDVDERFLEMLLEQGGYVIILDGYDELSESARKIIGEQITELALNYERNTIILTSRPEATLPEIPNSTVFNIEPLDKKQAKSIVLRYDAVANTSVGKGLITQIDQVSSDFLRTPILVVLLYKTYGYNQSIATKVSSFYDEVFNAFYKGHDLSKSGFSRPKLSGLDADDFRRLLRGFCFLLSMDQKSSLSSKTEAYSIIENSIKLTSTKPVSTASFFDDLLLSVPFVMKDGNEFRFIHKSIADFFAGEFLAHCHNSEEIIGKILTSKKAEAFSKSFDFLADLNPSLFRRSIVAPLARQILEEDLLAGSILQTVYFLGGSMAAISIETTQRDKSAFRMITSAKEKPSGKIADLHGKDIHRGVFHLEGQLLTVTIVQLNRPLYLSSAAWKLLSVTFTEKFGSIESLKNVTKVLKPGKYYSVNSEYIFEQANKGSLQVLLFFVVQMLQPREYDRRPRIIDREACKRILDTIREEQETQNWLSGLIGK